MPGAIASRGRDGRLPRIQDRIAIGFGCAIGNAVGGALARVRIVTSAACGEWQFSALWRAVTRRVTRTASGTIGTVTITYTFVGVPVSEYGTAYEWYTRLLGRPADMFPHQTEAVWRLTPNGAIYVVQDPDRAGSGLLTVVVDDLDAYQAQLRDAGIEFAEQPSGDAPRRLVVTDGDGNTLAFFEDPGRTRSSAWQHERPSRQTR